MSNMKATCSNCPWRKDITPGALGGSPPETYIDQVYGPFILPCHKACDFDNPEWKQKTNATPQCAGAAHFRANVGISCIMPQAIHKLPPSPTVFGGAVEFMTHHKGITEEQAIDQFQIQPVHELYRLQMARSSNINFGKNKS